MSAHAQRVGRRRDLKVFQIRLDRAGPHVPGTLPRPRCLVASPTRADAVRALQALAPTIDDAFVRRRATVTEDPREVRVASREPGTVFVAVVEEAHAPEHFEPLRPYGGW